MSATPKIAELPAHSERPSWSVMIPTRCPTQHLEKALRSVLDQDPGAREMQIAVLDDASPDTTARAIAERVGGKRVEIHRHDTPRGIAGNWNACIERSRGRWVHILHQDDLALPGFYERLDRAHSSEPAVGAAFCRHRYVDADGRPLGEGARQRVTAGVWRDWLEHIAIGNHVQCAAIAVRRSTYEAIGGFRNDLPFTLDWEMWIRVASRFPVWYEPEALAAFRVHATGETARLCEDGSNVSDLLRAIEVSAEHLPAQRRGELREQALRGCVEHALAQARRLLGAGRTRAADAQLREAWKLAPWRRLDPRIWGLVYRSAMATRHANPHVVREGEHRGESA